MRTRLAVLTTAVTCLAGFAGTAQAAETATFTQNTDITFQDLGYANPLPSTIQVAGVKGVVTSVGLRFDDFTDDRPSDADTLLVGPTGQTLVPVSDAGAATAVSNLDFVFQDGAAVFSQPGPLTSGTFQPTDYDPNEVMGMGAPDPPYGTTLAGFKGKNANGTWKLYGFSDFFDGDSDGSISAWTLTITSEPATIDLTAKKQKLGGKVKLVATSNAAVALALSGGVKPKIVQLAAGAATPFKAKLKPAKRKSLAAKLADGKTAKTNVIGTITDATGSTATDTVKVKFKL